MAAFERDREAGRRNTHIVAPPGSGKTLLGVELVRRVGRARARAHAQQRRADAVAARGAPVRGAVRRRADGGPEPFFPIACMTYQSLCQLDDPGAAIRQVAAARWATDRAAATGVEVEEALAEGAAYEGTAADRRAERDRPHHRRRQARDRPRRARRDRAGRAVLRDRPQAASTPSRRPASARSCSTSATTSPRCGATSYARCSTSCATRTCT